MSEASYSKIRWRSRRGMLELDLILLPFVDEHFSKLSAQQKAQYQQLLTQPDPDIYNWLMGYTKSDNPALQSIIDTIRHQQNL